MKVSNYIVLAFFVFIIGCTLILFISAKGHEDYNSFTDKEYFIDKEFSLDSVKVIVAEQGASLALRVSDKSSLSIRYSKDGGELEFLYRISNDTLFVPKVETSAGMYYGINVRVRYLSSIVAKNNSSIRIDSLSSDNLKINAEQARVSIYNTTVNEMVIEAIHSEISISSATISSIFAKLENESRFSIDSKGISKIDVEKDQNSRYSAY